MPRRKGSIVEENKFVNDFEIFKKRFEKEVNSVRRLDEIKNFEDLLDVLDDRDALSTDLLKDLEPKFERIFKFKFEKSVPLEQTLPAEVRKLITCSFEANWRDFGMHLNLTEYELAECKGIEDVLSKFQSNCFGISDREIAFRLCRALEKSGRNALKSEVLNFCQKPVKMCQ